VVERVVVHMNKDHQESVLAYARHYGKLSLANAATLVSVDHEGQSAIPLIRARGSPA
jgi:hypothetical protein